MMRLSWAALVAMLFWGALAVPAAGALEREAMSPADVVAIDRALDGTQVVVEGEAIGESLSARGGGRWINISRDTTGLGIWVTDEMAALVEHYGAHHHNGDIVRVTGTVNIVCDRHDGEFDVHAESLEVVQRGGPREMEIQPYKGIAGAVGLFLALVLYRWYQLRRDRRVL